jgi:hypothetical protein
MMFIRRPLLPVKRAAAGSVAGCRDQQRQVFPEFLKHDKSDALASDCYKESGNLA